MRRAISRSGFTVVELLVASTAALIIFTALGSTMLFCQRMLRETMAEAELALAQRDLRDKLLFRAGPDLNEGLLTGKARGDSAAITMDWQTGDNASVNHGPDKIRLLLKNDADGNYLFNERCPHNDRNDRWFKPSGFRVKANWAQTIDLPLLKIDLGSTLLDSIQDTTWILLPQ